MVDGDYHDRDFTPPGSHDVFKPFIMDSLNQGVAALNKGIDDLTTYIRENGVAIGILFLIFYYIRNSAIKKKAELFHGHVLAQDSTSARNATSREEELRLVRLRQQELADQRANEAARLAKEKEQKERERKNNVARKEIEGDRLGSTTTTTTPSTTTRNTTSSRDESGFSPLQPWASHSTGYRPPRRTVNRG